MVIYLRHPVHGMKVAVSDQEALMDEKNGWTRFDVKSLVVEQPGVVRLVTNPEREELVSQYVEKFGRKPHWKLSTENIRKELNAESSGLNQTVDAADANAGTGSESDISRSQ